MPSTAATPGLTATGTVTAKPSPPPTSRAPSAADQLGAFFTAAQRLDGRLRQTAALVNTGIGAESLMFSTATFAAIRAIDVKTVLAAIPAGMPERLERQAMLVYNDLVSRADSLKGPLIAQYQQPLKRTDFWSRFIMDCLSNGAPAAAKFPGDLSSTRNLAASLPRFRVAAPDSRAAAAIAVRAMDIGLANGGCLSCGGVMLAQPIPIVWTSASAKGRHLEGTVSGVQFTADYKPGQGWIVEIRAC